MGSSNKRFIFLLSHPIQYFSPLLVEIAKQPDIDLLVLYCSDENVKEHIDRGFGVNIKWDIPLLEGYKYKFLKNNSWKSVAANGFWGLINFEIFKVLKKERGSFLVIHGWNYFTHFSAIIYGKLAGLKVCIRGDNPYNQEMLKSKKLLFIKKIILGKFLFNFIDYFLFVGNQNKEFYKYFGVPNTKLIFTPHAVDNDRFRAEYEKFRNKRTEIRQELGLPIDKKIILTVGKYTSVKNQLNLIVAFNQLNSANAALVIVGEGELRNEMEEYIQTNQLKYVYLTGFKNQTKISEYFITADIFALPSKSETWGLVVNEAMNFALPIILSDMVGCVDDLVKENENGFMFKCGDLAQLISKLDILIDNDKLRRNFGSSSLSIINDYSYKSIIERLLGIL